jgi:CheY-like chemotaxis protein
MLYRKLDANRSTGVDFRGNLAGEDQADEEEISTRRGLFNQEVQLARSYSKEGMEQNMMSAEEALKIPRYNVLVVDDEEGVRNLVATLMSRRGHQCFQATDGVDALAKAKTIRFDAIITDIVMPKMDGISLIKEVLMIRPRLPIMVMTAFKNDFTPAVAKATGARDIITKPFSLMEFYTRFDKMMSDHEKRKRIDLYGEGIRSEDKPTA